MLNEFAHNVLRKFPEITYEELYASLESMIPFCRAQVTEWTALQALAIHRRFKFSFYDSALIGSALAFGCDLFLSEDLAHNQRLGAMRIIDPFRVDPTDYLQQN